MQNRNIAEALIEYTYNQYKNDWQEDNAILPISEELNTMSLGTVWAEMDDNTKCSAIEYVYKNRKEIELHSGCVEAWVQATAYFMIQYGLSDIEMISPEEFFFDDTDFMIEDELSDDVKERFGVLPNFNDQF